MVFKNLHSLPKYYYYYKCCPTLLLITLNGEENKLYNSAKFHFFFLKMNQKEIPPAGDTFLKKKGRKKTPTKM